MILRSPTLPSLTERASNDPQRMRARKLEGEIMEAMPANERLTCRAVSRLIGVADERKIRARLDRLTHAGKIERRREQGDHGPVYLYRRRGASAASALQEPSQLKALISDLRQMARNLDIAIEAQEDRALARDVGARRDNLLATISTLEIHLNDVGC